MFPLARDLDERSYQKAFAGVSGFRSADITIPEGVGGPPRRLNGRLG